MNVIYNDCLSRAGASESGLESLLAQRLVRVVGIALLLAATIAEGAALTYPAMGNLNPVEGTVELWLTPLFDPAEGVDTRFWAADIFQVGGGETSVRVFWRKQRGHSGPNATGQTRGHGLGRLFFEAGDRPAGEAMHLAYVWEPGKRAFYLNGERMAQRPPRIAKELVFDERSAIVIGDDRRDSAPQWVIEELRISSVVRQPEELGYHFRGTLRPDRWTLLLDPFVPSGRTATGQVGTRPAVMTPGPEGDRRGVLDGGGAFIELPNGRRGLQL